MPAIAALGRDVFAAHGLGVELRTALFEVRHGLLADQLVLPNSAALEWRAQPAYQDE